MQQPESYWTRKGPPIPEVRDLPGGAFKGGERAWGSLSPGMRREIWRDAIYREALGRDLSPDILSRLRTMTISGYFISLDEYLGEIERVDAQRPALKEDTERLERAETLHQQSEVQIAAREGL